MEGEHRGTQDSQVRLAKQDQTIINNNTSDHMVPKGGCPKDNYKREEKGVYHHRAGGSDIREEWTTSTKVCTIIITIMHIKTWAHSSPTF